MKSLLFSLPLLLLVPSCAPLSSGQAGNKSYYLSDYEQPEAGPTENPNDPNKGGYWDGDGVEGSASIHINRAEQKAYFYKGKQLVGVSPISSGSSTHTTPPGRFKVTQKDIDHRSSLYGVIKNKETGAIVNPDADTRKHRAGPGEEFINAPMFHFLRFNGPIGMHTGHLPGYPASHGCVRLPDHMAAKFFQHSKLGTPIIVE